MTQTGVKQSIVTRVRVAFLFVAVFSAAVVWKVSRIQFVEGERWKQKTNARPFSYQPVRATRGNIYSDNESILATSLPFYRVAWDPTVVEDELFDKNVDSLAWHLSHFFGDKSQETYRRKLINAKRGRTKVRYLRLNNRQVDYQQKKAVAHWPIFRKGQNRGGIIFEKVDRRFMPFGELAQRTIGYVSEGKSGAGIEYTFNDHLAGRDGEALFERIAGGWRPVHDGSEVKPVPGYDVVTTIDINLQDVAETALRRAVIDNDAAYGTVVLMDVTTGQIKAIANLGRKSKGVYTEDYNYACADQGLTEPGSTFKLASMMALLEDDPKASLHDTVNTGNGSMLVGGAVKTDTHGHGRISRQQVFELSSNIGVAKLTWDRFKDDPARYVKWLRSFGLGNKIGLQLGGEAQPVLRGPESKLWSKPSLTTMSIGYEVRVAPIHTLAFYNAVANNGVKVRPYIIKEIRQADQVVQHFEPVVLNKRICSDATVKKLRLMMEGVVENGTGKHVKTPDYKVAGKTGTAWKLKNGRYVKQYSTSFVGYFPADDPKYSAIVIIDSPSAGRIYGGDVAAPVFRELADKAYALDPARQAEMAGRVPDTTRALLPALAAGQQDELALICDRLGISHHSVREADDWVRAAPPETATVKPGTGKDAKHAAPARPQQAVTWQRQTVRTRLVPDLTGLSLRDALYLAGERHLRVTTVGQGRIVGQSLAAGTPVPAGGADLQLTLQAPLALDSLPLSLRPLPGELAADRAHLTSIGPARGRSERRPAAVVPGPKRAEPEKKAAVKPATKPAARPAAKPTATGSRTSATAKPTEKKKATSTTKPAPKKPADKKPAPTKRDPKKPAKPTAGKPDPKKHP